MIAFFLGQGSVAFWPTIPSWLTWPWGLLLMAVVLLSAVAHARSDLPANPPTSALGLGLLGILWGVSYAGWWQEHQLPPHWQGVDLDARGTVLGLVQHQAGRCRFDFELEHLQNPTELTSSHRIPRRVRLSWYQCKQSPNPGDRLSLKIRLKRLHGYHNPGGFDYPLYLIGRGVDATGYVRNNFVLYLGQARWKGWVDRLRQQLVSRLSTDVISESGSSLLAAMLLGDRRGLSDDDWALLRDTGTAHLVVVSGLHIGMLAAAGYGLVMLAGRLFPQLSYPYRRGLAALAAIAISGLYAMLAGFSLPTQRAWVMVCAWMLGLMLLRQLGPWRRLLLAAVIVQMIEPLALRQSSFWLSFGACAALIWVGYGRLRPLTWWRQLVLAQLAVTIGLLPWLLFYFQQGSMWAPLINLVAVPLVMLMLPLAFVGLLLVLGGAEVTLPLQLCGWLLSSGWQRLTDLQPLLTAWPLAGPISGWVVGLALLGSMLLLFPLNRVRWLGLACWLPLLMPPADRPEPAGLRITMIDVGQGLSMLVQTHQHDLLYDTGPRFRSGFSAAEAAIIPYLYSRGIRQLDGLMISHQDNDHAGGRQAIEQRLAVGQVWTGESQQASDRLCRAGQRWQWDGVQFEVLYPFAETDLEELDSNNRSCVLKVSAANLQLLLSGDIDQQVEQQLIQRYGFKLQSSDLLVAHHGSNSSSSAEFIRVVAPQRGWISSGWRNRFGHPHPQVVERYNTAGVELLNTIEQGAVTLQVDAAGKVELQSSRQMTWRYWEAD